MAGPRCCAPPGCGTTIRSPLAVARATPRASSMDAGCRRTRTRRASTRPARPRRSPRWSWRWTPGAGPASRFGCDRARLLGSPRTEVAVTFKQPQRVPIGLTGCDQPDRLRIGIALGAGRVGLELNVSGPGDPFEIDPLTVQADLGPGELPPYGEVLRGILEGEPALSVRGDMAVDCWRIIEPVQKVWRDDEVPLKEYPAGSTVTDRWPLSGFTRP